MGAQSELPEEAAAVALLDPGVVAELGVEGDLGAQGVSVVSSIASTTGPPAEDGRARWTTANRWAIRWTSSGAWGVTQE